MQLEPVRAGPGFQLAGRSGGEDAAVVDDDDGVGEPVGFLGVLSGQQQRGALSGQLAEQLPQGQAAAGIRRRDGAPQLG